MDKNIIYMDMAASTPPSQEVLQVMRSVASKYGNPSSVHDYGQINKAIIDSASDNISSILNCGANELYYTSGATMSNSVAIQGWLRRNPEGVIVVSEIEHNDIIEMCRYLEKEGHRIEWVGVDHKGAIDLDALERIVKYYSTNIIEHTPILVSIQMANSETGITQEIEDISRLVHNYNAVLHTDATQYIPHFPIDVQKNGIDMLSMSGQKINCIKGTGLLYIKNGIDIDPVIFGEQGLIGGTENVIGIACLSTAFSGLKEKHGLYNYTNVAYKRNRLVKGLSDICQIVESEHRLPNYAPMLFKKIRGEDLVYLLNEHGIYVSSGSACSSHNMRPSHVLKAMGYSDEEASSCVRFTIDNSISNEEIDHVIKTVHTIIKLIRNG